MYGEAVPFGLFVSGARWAGLFIYACQFLFAQAQAATVLRVCVVRTVFLINGVV